MSYIVTVAHKK